MKPWPALLGAACLVDAARAVAAGLHGELALASDYSYRGLRWSDSAPTYQAYLEYGWRSGFYLGAWASTIDLAYYLDDDQLISYYGGYTHRLSRDWSVDITALHHDFMGGRTDGPDYDEFLVTWHRDHRWSFTAGYAHDYLGLSQDTGILEMTFRQPLPGELIVDLNLGRQMGSASAASSFTYGEIGLSRGLGPWALRYSVAASDCRSGTPLCREHERIQHMIRLSWSFPP